MDKWKWKEIKCMELGGNKNAMTFYEKNDMVADGKPNHKAPALQKYKADLARRAEIAIGLSNPISTTIPAKTEPETDNIFGKVKPAFGKQDSITTATLSSGS
jgi:hypothetical protein